MQQLYAAFTPFIRHVMSHILRTGFTAGRNPIASQAATFPNGD